jgi:acyl transferase domain-containing protein/glutamate-1-semialdehyde aminotransferase
MKGECSGIAIVGMAGRFPGAPDVRTFWQNLERGVESIRHFSADEMDDAFESDVRNGPEYVRARAIVDDVDLFDAGFFGIHRRDAELIDPQQRIFLECCWEALEDAGYDPATYPGAIGVYAGCSINTYVLRNVLSDRSSIGRFTSDYPVGSYPELLGAGHDFLTTRVSYKLNLRGPAMTVQSACSTSLLAVAQAAQTLMLGQADMMLAGGVSISFPQNRGYIYQSGGMVSADGHCRTFDARSNGTVFGDGAGVVLLKRFEDAVADGDAIYAVIRGFGVNNDAAAKVGYTAPGIDGQVAAVRAAHAMAEFPPQTVGFIECHGTATPLGDPIEIAALVRAFDWPNSGGARIAIGSVKPNVGHLDVAAGIAGLIKTTLAVKTGSIPATVNFSELNPHIELAGSPFFVSGQRTTWPIETSPRRAGVSAFGVGGTNVHLAIESAPDRERDASALQTHVFLLSARTEAALGQARTRLAMAFDSLTDADLPDVAYTLARGRRSFAYRDAIVASSAVEAAAKLRAPLRAGTRKVEEDPAIAFMFPGQGSQYVGMGSGLYEQISAFRDAIDRCATILHPLLGEDLRAFLYPVEVNDDAQARLRKTTVAQVALFSVEYALACVWGMLGIAPAAMIGHSVGEFVAAVLAGVFSLEEALALVHERGRLMGSLPEGAMLAVRLSEDALSPLVSAPISIAALNAPGLSVVAGPTEAINALEVSLNESGIICRRLHTSHAFHSSMMDPIVDPLTWRAAEIDLQAPRIPYVSGVTGDWILPDESTSPAYWARHCREPVRFAMGIDTLVAGGVNILIEIGPGVTLSTFALRGAARGGGCIVHGSLPTNEREKPDLSTLLEAAAKLWIAGAPIDIGALYRGERRVRISLPTYPFERSRYWIDAPGRPVVPATNRLAQTVKASVNHIDAKLSRRSKVASDITALFEEFSGDSLAGADPLASFLELGFDSLFLGRIVQQIANRFGVAVTFRQLLGTLPSIAALSEYVAAALPASDPRIETMEPATSGLAAMPNAALSTATTGESPIQAVMRDQIVAMQALMNEQLAVLERIGGSVQIPVPTAITPPQSKTSADTSVAATPSRLDAFRILPHASQHSEMTPAQQAHIDELVQRTVARTSGSKSRTALFRSVLADPRVAAGFRTEWKEMVYPITCVRAKGARIWDIDGNEYIDILNGFGQTAFGHSPDFVVDAIQAQLRDGFAIGPQTDLAGEVAQLFCELTHNERVTFCNTGSEAVMAAMRVARAVTGRNKIVVFDGAYHGQFDEVLVKSARGSSRSLPVAAGIPNESVSNMTVLEYGAAESLTWIRDHAHEIAAVIVEPVQSRHPALVPRDFLLELRAITTESGSALVFDEVVTGFRVHPGGMQALLKIRADLATYGKVVGGGMPVGILAGTARFMDALDGGMWEYGDDSFPQVAPTFFAGTFVRHPLTMAAVLAVLRHLREGGPGLQEALSARTADMVSRLNATLHAHGVATQIEHFGSIFYVNLSREHRFANLMFYHLRNRGIYIQEGFPCFLTTAHTEEDVHSIVRAFDESLIELQSVGILNSSITPWIADPREPAHAELVLRDSDTLDTDPMVGEPLTEEQQEIWLAAQVGDAASCAFNESVTMYFDGGLHRETFEVAWRTIIARHEALRLVFAPTGEFMKVDTLDRVSFRFRDLQNIDRESAETELRSAIRLDAVTPIDLVAGPPVRAELFCLAADRYAFHVTAHHIVCDGWSFNLIISEFAQTYSQLVTGEQPNLPESMGYLEYARRQRDRKKDEIEKIEAFWLVQYRDPVERLELPTDRPRLAHRDYRGDTCSTFIGKEQHAALKRASGRNGLTLFVTLLAAYQLLLGKLAGSNDVVVGIPAAGQSALAGVSLVGHCVNFLPIRTRWSKNSSLIDMFRSARDRVLDAYEHQSYTFGTLLNRLNVSRSDGRVPLTESQFNLERLADNVHFGSVVASVVPGVKAFVYFDLFLNIIESREGLRLDVDYNAGLYDQRTIQALLQSFQNILDAFVVDSEATLDTVVPIVNPIHVLFEGPIEAEPASVDDNLVGDFSESERHIADYADETATLLEQKLLAIVTEVLGRDDVVRTSDLLSLGVDSLQIFKIVARANKVGLYVLAKDLLQKRTIQKVARTLGDEKNPGQRLSKMPPTRLIPAHERQGRV